jgi:hypothetical protein
MDRRAGEPLQLAVLLLFVEGAVDDFDHRGALVSERRNDACQFLAGPVARRRMQDNGRRKLTGARSRRLSLGQDQLVRREGSFAARPETDGRHC